MKKERRILMTTYLLLMISFSVSIAMLPSNTASASSERYTQYPWVTAQHDFYRTGYTLSPAPMTNHTLWKVQMFGANKELSSLGVIVKNGLVFTPMVSSVGAFDAITGAKVWESELPFYHFDDRMSGLTIDDYARVWVCDAHYVYALDEITGKVLSYFNMTSYQRSNVTWTGRLGRSAAPTVVGTTIYVSTKEGTTYCLTWSTPTATVNPLLGTKPAINLKWHFHDLGLEHLGDMLGSPIVVGSGASAVVYQTCSENNTVILDPRTGKNVTSRPGSIYCLNANTGAQIWKFVSVPTTYSYYSFLYGATYVSGKLYAGESSGRFYCLNATTGNVIWNKTIGGGTWCGPAAAYGKLYIGAKDSAGLSFGNPLQPASNSLYCLDQVTGSILWSYNYSQWGYGYSYPTYHYPLYAYTAPAVASGVVFQTIEGYGGPSYLFALNATTGTFIWRSPDLDVGGTYDYACNPAVADGRVYVKNGAGGILYCFGDGPTTTSVSFISSKLNLNDTAWIMGTLVDSSPANAGTPIAGAEITLTYTKLGGSSTFIANVSTGLDGSYSYAWTPPSVGGYIVSASFAGGTPMLPSSGTAMIQVEPAAPTKEQIAGEVIDGLPAYPEPPTKEEIAGEVINELPSFSTAEIVLAALVVITLLLVAYNIFTVRKLQK